MIADTTKKSKPAAEFKHFTLVKPDEAELAHTYAQGEDICGRKVDKQISIRVFYDKGGVNYFSGGRSSRGVHIVITPQETSAESERVRITSFTVGSGMRGCLLELKAKSPKKFLAVALAVDQVVPWILEWLHPNAEGEIAKDELQSAIRTAQDAVVLAKIA
jgi:hypothetical protein